MMKIKHTHTHTHPHPHPHPHPQITLTAACHTHNYRPHSQLHTTLIADKTGISAIYYNSIFYHIEV